MKFSCLQENLAKGLNIVSRAVPVKSPLPILSNILIKTEDGRIKLAATNLETTVVTYIGASVEEEGVITIPAKIFKEFITNLPADTLNLDLQNNTLHVKSKKTKSKFNGSSANDYPDLPIMPEKSKFVEFDTKEFGDAISMVAFASGTDSSRPVFTGIYMKWENNNLVLASSDGFRLSEKFISAGGDSESASVVIPSKTLVETAKIFYGSAKPIKFTLDGSKNLALFESDDTFVATRILDGEYPDYKRIIPTSTNLSATFKTEDFLEAVKLTSIFAKESGEATQIIKVRLDPDEGIKVSSMAEETGDHESNFEAEIEGSLTEIAFNAKYLMDLFNNAKSEKMVLRTAGNLTPCSFALVNEDTQFIHIIMPMQI